MKVALTALTALALSLMAGIAYAAYEASPSAELNNGITYFDTGPACDCESVRSAAAGGLVLETAAETMNGVTYFESALPGAIPIGLCAGKIFEEVPSVSNGITYFGESW